MNEYYVFWAVMALVSLPLSLSLAASGLLALNAALAFAPPKRVKVFRDKFGQQCATFALFAGLVALAALGGAMAAAHFTLPEVALFWMGLPLPAGPLAASLLAACVLTVAYRGAWQAMAARKALHACLGLAATLCALAFGYFALTGLRHFVLSPTTPTLGAAYFLPQWDSNFWLLAPLTLTLCVGSAGAWAGAYLVYRRDKDDFGRDYYSYSMKLAAAWALCGALAALACQGGLVARLWPVVRELPLRPLFFWCQCGSAAGALMAATLWAIVLRSKNPLRLKFHLVMAVFLCWLALGAQLGGYVRFYLG